MHYVCVYVGMHIVCVCLWKPDMLEPSGDRIIICEPFDVDTGNRTLVFYKKNVRCYLLSHVSSQSQVFVTV